MCRLAGRFAGLFHGPAIGSAPRRGIAEDAVPKPLKVAVTLAWRRRKNATR